MQALGSMQDTVANATFEHEPQLPGIKGQTEAIYGRLRSRADPVYNAIYDNDPQLPGIKGQTELIKLRINKRLRSESRVYEAEAGPPVKKLIKTEHMKMQCSSRTNKKDEMDAITRLVRANNV